MMLRVEATIPFMYILFESRIVSTVTSMFTHISWKVKKTCTSRAITGVTSSAMGLIDQVSKHEFLFLYTRVEKKTSSASSMREQAVDAFLLICLRRNVSRSSARPCRASPGYIDWYFFATA
jgi:hypothetical protein